MSRSKNLDAIFDLLADEMKKMLTEGKVAIDKESGEALHVSPDAATLNVIRQFLKDNGITAASEGEGHDKLHQIGQALPFPHVETEYAN
jgi:predicted deacylase